MKHARYYILLGSAAFLLSSCSLFKPKYGCGDNGGRNVGSEKLLSDPPQKDQEIQGIGFVLCN